ncbi:hypothetical protein MTO96_019394 [Rhipicephalus appendiculatus]
MAAAFFVLASTWIGCTAEDELTLQAGLTPCELIRYFDYPCEVSHATTEDGYVIEVDRVPRGRQDNATAPNEQNGTRRYPVLFVPVIAGASDLWFINYPSQSPGSFDEIGRYDVPAGVDHVLNATGADRLTLVSHSQGVTAILVFLSMRPEYNAKVDLVVAYGPVANVSHLEPPLSLLIPFHTFACRYLGATEGLSEFLAKVCEILFEGEVCSLAITITAFSSPYQLNETRLPVYVGHYPVGTTIQNFMHYYQMYKARDFVMYDHGAKENQKRYGQGDHVADPRDVKDLVARLGPRVIQHRVVPQKTLGHVDFSIGYRATDFLHNVAIDIVKQQIDESS